MTQMQTKTDAFSLVRTDLMGPMQKDLEAALRGAIPVEYWVRCALTTLRLNPRLLQCTRESIYASMMEAAQLGLILDGVTGYGHLVSYRDECKFIPGYKGLIKLALDGGGVRKMAAHVVREKDYLNVELGDLDTLTHRPDLEHPDAPIVGAYAVAWLTNGEKVWRYLPKVKLDKIRDDVLKRGKGRSSPWETHYEEMCLKTPVRALFKWLPLSDQAQHAAAVDEQIEAGVLPEREVEIEVAGDGTPQGQPTALQSLGTELEGARTTREAQEPSVQQGGSQDGSEPRFYPMPEAWRWAWDDTHPLGGYPYDVSAAVLLPEDWGNQPIGGRTGLKALLWDEIAPKSPEHDKLRELANTARESIDGGATPDGYQIRCAILLRKLDLWQDDGPEETLLEDLPYA